MLIKSQSIVENNLITAELDSAFADFLRLNVAQGDASPKTIASYRTEVRQYSLWCQDQAINPARATESDLLTYRRYLIETGYSRGTIATKLAAIRRFYEAATWRGLRPDNPAAGLKAPKEKTAREDKIKYLPLEGFKRLLSAPVVTTTAGIRDRAILALMGYHGLRVEEVCTLELDNLELDNLAANVIGKGSKTRKINLIEQSVMALAAWLKIRPVIDSPTVFCSLANNTPAGPMTTRAMRYLVDSYLDQTGLKAQGVSCHSLRHSFATWSRAGGASIDALAAEMGHSSTQTTLLYAKIVDRMQENPAKYLAALMGS